MESKGIVYIQVTHINMTFYVQKFLTTKDETHKLEKKNKQKLYKKWKLLAFY